MIPELRPQRPLVEHVLYVYLGEGERPILLPRPAGRVERLPLRLAPREPVPTEDVTDRAWGQDEPLLAVACGLLRFRSTVLGLGLGPAGRAVGTARPVAQGLHDPDSSANSAGGFPELDHRSVPVSLHQTASLACRLGSDERCELAGQRESCRIAGRSRERGEPAQVGEQNGSFL